MKIKDIKQEYYKRDYFYGHMYGTSNLTDKVIKIHIKATSLPQVKQLKGFCYVWGWPGPDYNFYAWTDYGKTWAYELEDFTIPYEYEE